MGTSQVQLKLLDTLFKAINLAIHTVCASTSVCDNLKTQTFELKYTPKCSHIHVISHEKYFPNTIIKHYQLYINLKILQLQNERIVVPNLGYFMWAICQLAYQLKGIATRNINAMFKYSHDRLMDGLTSKISCRCMEFLSKQGTIT